MSTWLSANFASPLAWLTLLALCVPIIIHLLSKSKAQLIKFAHVALIPTGNQKPVTQLTITQWILLLLRLLLLILLAWMLSQPLVSQYPQDKAEQPVMLITQQWLNVASPEQRQDVAAQIQSGAQALLLGYPEIALSAQQVEDGPQATRTNADTLTAVNVWSFLSRTLTTHEGEVAVYTTHQADQFSGTRQPINPTDESRVQWHIAETSDENKSVSDHYSLQLALLGEQSPNDQRRWQTALALVKQHVMPGLTWQPLENATAEQLLPFDLTLQVAELTVSKQEGAEFQVSSEAITDTVKYIDATTVDTSQRNFVVWLAKTLAASIDKGEQEQQQYLTLSAAQISLLSTTDNTPARHIPTSDKTAQPHTPWPYLPWLAMLVLVLFSIERVLSERQSASQAQETNL